MKQSDLSGTHEDKKKQQVHSKKTYPSENHSDILERSK